MRNALRGQVTVGFWERLYRGFRDENWNTYHRRVQGPGSATLYKAASYIGEVHLAPWCPTSWEWGRNGRRTPIRRADLTNNVYWHGMRATWPDLFPKLDGLSYGHVGDLVEIGLAMGRAGSSVGRENARTDCVRRGGFRHATRDAWQGAGSAHGALTRGSTGPLDAGPLTQAP